MAGSVSEFCRWMRVACEDWSLGYDQSNRWDIRDGGECDCSSLVIWALRKAGFDTGEATYTGNVLSELLPRGWRSLPFAIDNVKAGDILLNEACHVCAVISGSGRTATIAQASIDERGRVTGGASGDQTGKETNVRQVYVYAYGWDCILRYEGGDDDATGGVTLDVDGVLGALSVSEWQRQVNTPVDGCVSGQLKECQRSYPALAAVTFEGTGSALMERVQELVGVPNPTGIISGGTVCMLQGWLVLHGHSCADDKAGVLGECTAKALQESLNAGEWSR